MNSATATRCETCGFYEPDYRSATSQRWIRTALGSRSSLILEDLPKDMALEGFGTANSLKTSLRELANVDLHEAVHLSTEAARAASRLFAVEQEGTVDQVSCSGGGVPKTEVSDAAVSWRGLEGDRQGDRRHHGQPWQALCLYSSNVIGALQQEGHPIGFGSAGENITIGGLDWSALRTGQLLSVGEVLCELTVPTVPCEKNAQWFAAGDFLRMSYSRHKGWSRWYAAVLRPGRVRRGDTVLLRTPPAIP